MKTKLLAEGDDAVTVAVVLETGDEIMASLVAVAQQHGVGSASFTAIGAVRSARLGYYDPQDKSYAESSFDEQLEVLALVGDIAQQDGAPQVHAHITLGRRDMTTLGGHLFEAEVRPTLEVFVRGYRTTLVKTEDEATRLALIDPAL